MNYPSEDMLPKERLYHYLLQPGEEHDNHHMRATSQIWSKKTYRLSEVVSRPGNRVMYSLKESRCSFPKTQSCHWIMFKNGEKNVLVSKTAEQGSAWVNLEVAKSTTTLKELIRLGRVVMIDEPQLRLI